MRCTYCNKPVTFEVRANETRNFYRRNIMCYDCGVKKENLIKAEKEAKKANSVSYIVNFLSLFFFPLGLIMFIVWRNKKPRAARYALIFALIPIAFKYIVVFINSILQA